MIVDFNKYAEAQRAKDIDIVDALSERIGEKRAICLRRSGVENLGDLSGLHVSNIEIMYGFGTKTILNIEEVLASNGLEGLDHTKEDLTDEVFARMLEFMSEDEAIAASEHVFTPEDSPAPRLG